MGAKLVRRDKNGCGGPRIDAAGLKQVQGGSEGLRWVLWAKNQCGVIKTGTAGSRWVRRNDRCGGRQGVCGGRQNVCGGTKKPAVDQKKLRRRTRKCDVIEQKPRMYYKQKFSAA